MGLTVRDDPKKVVDIAGRTWGQPLDGLALSLQLRTKEDPDELPAVSVAIQNSGAVAVPLKIHGWLDFYKVSVKDAQNSQAAMTSYGQELMKPEHQQQLTDIVLEPGRAIEADIPIGSIYRMNGRYRVTVSCEAPGGTHLISNEIEISTL